MTTAQDKPERVDIGVYLDEVVYPTLFDRFDVALPEPGRAGSTRQGMRVTHGIGG